MSPAAKRVVAIWCLISATGLVRAQTRSPQSFRTEAAYVSLAFVALGQDHRPIRDLDAADLVVTENGRPQHIEKFINHGSSLASGECVVLAQKASSITIDNAPRRAYLIVLDLFHSSPSQRPRIENAIRTFLDRYLEPTDLAALIVLSLRPQASMFSANASVVLAALRDQGLSGRFSDGGLDLGTKEANEAFAAGNAALDAAAADRSLEQLARVSEVFGALTGTRKTILMFSEGVSTDLFAGANPQARDAAQRVIEAQQQFLQRAAAADVTVYPIDVRGLAAIDPYSSGEPPGLREWESLRVLADGTGGVAFVGRRDLAPVFDQIRAETTAYYEIGYYSTVPSDGKPHKISVESRRPGVSIRTRPFVPPTPSRATTPAGAHRLDMRALLDRALPVSDERLRIRASATVDRQLTDGVATKLRVEVLDWGPVTLPGNGSPSAPPQVGVAVYDVNGRRRLERIAELPAQGRLLVTTLKIPRGLSQIRVAVSNGAGGSTGSIVIDADFR